MLNCIGRETFNRFHRQMKPVNCPNCSHKMPVREADAEIREFHPKAIGVINDSHGKDYAEKNVDKDSMIVFKCMTCGAGLELSNDTKRTIKCRYCDNENYLPDAIWTKLHPNKEVQPLFLLIDLSEDDMKSSVDYFLNVTALGVFRKHFANFIREYFEKPFISEAFLTWMKYFLGQKNNDKISFNMDIEKVQKYFYDNLLLGFENHPAELKAATAEYSYKLPAELQQKLSNDKDESIRTALSRNKSKGQKKGLFKSLFG